MTLAKAMIFAAGFGTRLGRLVADTPKPLIEIRGQTLIDHALDIVDDAGVGECVINLHYHGDKLASHLAHRRNVTLLWEYPDILDTGGGLSNAIDILGNAPVYTMNSDTIWRGPNPLLQLTRYWCAEQMDALLLLIPANKAIGHISKGGDFVISDRGRARRVRQNEKDGLIFTGAQIINTTCLSSIDKRVFSLNEIWDHLIDIGRLAAITYDGDIGDAGTLTGLESCAKM